METKLIVEFTPGVKTAVVLAEAAKRERAVVLIHGFMSNKESRTNRTLTERLLPQGIAACRFDLFGHGESDGPFQRLTLSRCLEQAAGAIKWLGEQKYSMLGLVGSSFGGLVALHLASRHPELFGVALKCPVSDYPPIWRARLGEGGMKNWREDNLLSFATPEGKARLEYSFYEDLLKYDSYAAARNIESPTLIVHGDGDESVPFDQSLRLFDTLRLGKDQAFEAIPGADHEFSRPEDFERMIARITKWVGQ